MQDFIHNITKGNAMLFKNRIILSLSLITYSFSILCMNQSPYTKSEFKKFIKSYKVVHGDLSNFPLWTLSGCEELVRIALKKGVNPEIHSLSNAVEANDVKMVAMLLDEDSSHVNECFSSRLQGTLKMQEGLSLQMGSFAVTSDTLLQYASRHLLIDVFNVLLVYNPDINKAVRPSETPKNILKEKMEEFDVNTSDYRRACAMLDLLLEYEKDALQKQDKEKNV